MSATTITVGWTISDMDAGYSSFSDGYRHGAKQHVETVTVDIPDDWTTEQVAEAVFVATNSPRPDDTAEQIRSAISATGYNGRGAHWSFSVGDTVTVGDQTVACANFGWDEVQR